MGRAHYYVISTVSAPNLIDFNLAYGSVNLIGQFIDYTGSDFPDSVFLRPGLILDFTESLGGIDRLYLSGSLSDYKQTPIGTSYIVLERGLATAPATYEKVTIKTNGFDKVIFADGSLKAADMASAGFIVSNEISKLVTSEKSSAPIEKTQTLNASVHAYAVGDTGATFAPVLPGMRLIATGTDYADTVYIAEGSVVDCTELLGGRDTIYFRGNWSDYTKSQISGSTKYFIFQRTINGVLEKITVAADSAINNDKWVFADGAVLANNAKSNLAANISSISGYDPSIKTPGVDLALQASALNNVENLDVSSNIVLKFSADVLSSMDASKKIHIVNDTVSAWSHGETTTSATMDISANDSTQVLISGNTVIINPAFDLGFGKGYHISIDAGAFVNASTGQMSTAVDGSTQLHFSTVTPGSYLSTATNYGATASQAMLSPDSMSNAHQWLDIEGVGDPNSAGVALNLAGAAFALVAKDYDPNGGILSGQSINDGIQTKAFHVAASNFGVNDLLYIDNQGTSPNAIDLSTILPTLNTSNFTEAPPTVISFAGNNSLPGVVDVWLEAPNNLLVFYTPEDLKIKLAAVSMPIISA